MIKHHISSQIWVAACIFVLIIFAQCANRGTPNGGLKDTTPPKVLEASPKNHSTNFNEDKIEIAFDEYVVLKQEENMTDTAQVSPEEE